MLREGKNCGVCGFALVFPASERFAILLAPLKVRDRLERNRKTRTRAGIGRGDLTERDVHGWHRPVHRNSADGAGNGRTAKSHRLGVWGGSVIDGRLHMGRTWRGDAAGGWKLRV